MGGLTGDEFDDGVGVGEVAVGGAEGVGDVGVFSLDRVGLDEVDDREFGEGEVEFDFHSLAGAEVVEEVHLLA